MVNNVVEFSGLIGEAWGKFEETKWLLSVPVVMSLMNYGKVLEALKLEGFHFGIQFPLPEPTPTLWSFVSLPGKASGALFSPEDVTFMVLMVLLGSYLEAGYLGSIRDEVLMRESSFLRNAGRDFSEFLKFNAMLHAVMMFLILTAVVSPLMALLAFLGLLLFLYAVYGTPFLISIYNLGFMDALTKSLSMAKNGGEYLDYAVKYLAAGALISIPLTLVVANMGISGLVVGLIISTPISLTLSTATVLFFIAVNPKSSEWGKL